MPLIGCTYLTREDTGPLTCEYYFSTRIQSLGCWLSFTVVPEWLVAILQYVRVPIYRTITYYSHILPPLVAPKNYTLLICLANHRTISPWGSHTGFILSIPTLS